MESYFRSREDRSTGEAALPGRLESLERRLVLSFAAPVSYNAGIQNTLGLNGFGPQVITGDWNGDGKFDLAVTDTADGTVNILAGLGNRTFKPAVTYSTGLGAGHPVWLAWADFNGDGKPDLAVEGNNSISILMGNGDGTFATAKVYAAGSTIRGGLAVGDFFGNGRADIAVADFVSNNVDILPNNGNGTFGNPVVIPMPSSFSHIRSIATGNIFDNGRADLVVAGGEGYNNVNLSTDPGGVALLKNDSSGHFTYQGEFLAIPTPDPGGGNGAGDTVNPEHVNVADLNGDGKPDIVLSLYDHNIDVFLNAGDGTFGSAAGYTTETPGSVGGYPRGVAFADVNHDGKVDILTDNFGEPQAADQSTPEPGSIGVLYGNGDGTFQSPIQYTPYTYPGGLAVGDFNGDGLPDLAVAQNYTGHSVGVMMNQPNTSSQPPTVTGLSPTSGPSTGGTVVTITGSNFTGTTQVDFGSVAATAFVVLSDTTILATSPSESEATVDVTVYNAGASAVSPADRFLFSASILAPKITGVSPSVGSTAGGTSVTITGLNLNGATLVKFGGIAASFSVSSPTSIIATSPGQSVGVVDITVTTPAATSTTSSLDHFTYQTPVVSTITVTPAYPNLIDGSTQTFVATSFDQFGKVLTPQPTYSWSVTGLGSVTGSGVYTAPGSGSGYAYVTATVAGLNGSARLTYSPLISDVWTGLGATSNWSDAANWSALIVPSASTSVIFNGTSAKSAVVDPAFLGNIGSLQTTSLYPGRITLARSLAVAGTFAEGGGSFNANAFTTSVGGATTLYSNTTYLASTSTQSLVGGLVVAGGTFVGPTGTVYVGAVTLSSGALDAPSGILDVTGGNFTASGGLFNSDLGTVAYTGVNASPTLSLGTGSIRYFNFTNSLTDTYPAGMTITGTLTVTGTFAWKVGAGVIYGNIEAQGDVDDENHGGIGNPYLTLDGASNQKIEDLTGGGGGQFRTITINKSGGVVSLACNPIVFSGLTLAAGLVSSGAFSWFDTGPISAGPGLNLGNLTVDGNNVTVVGSNIQVANLTFAASADKLTAPSGSLSVSGNWNDAVGGGFVSNGGTVVFDGTAGPQQFNSGDGSFNNIMILAGSTVILEADLTLVNTLSGLGTLNLNGYKLRR